MRVRHKSEHIEAEAYPPLANSKGMLVKYYDPVIIKQKDRCWDLWEYGSYEVIKQ